jgi:hypothetical protein
MKAIQQYVIYRTLQPPSFAVLRAMHGHRLRLEADRKSEALLSAISS